MIFSDFLITSEQFFVIITLILSLPLFHFFILLLSLLFLQKTPEYDIAA